MIVKLYLRHPLHAKLYILFRPKDPVSPSVAYLGSSNLTLAGLCLHGELNVDVLDHDACNKLARWFEDRWKDHWCIDISDDLVAIIEESWARREPIPPYHIYVKMAYHLQLYHRDWDHHGGVKKNIALKAEELGGGGEAGQRPRFSRHPAPPAGHRPPAPHREASGVGRPPGRRVGRRARW